MDCDNHQRVGMYIYIYIHKYRNIYIYNIIYIYVRAYWIVTDSMAHFSLEFCPGIICISSRSVSRRRRHVHQWPNDQLPQDGVNEKCYGF